MTGYNGTEVTRYEMCIRESKMKAKLLWDKQTSRKVSNRFV